MLRPDSTHLKFFINLTVDEIRCKIDQRIEQLERDVRALKMVRNSLAPIAKLPPEILTRVFEYAAPRGFHRWEERINVTHVCSTWRAAALACPSLWSQINLGSWKEVMARDMLTRSKAHPIYLNLRNLPSWVSTVKGLDLLSSLLQMSRVQELQIKSDSTWEIEAISKSISGECATEMRSLYVNGKGCTADSCVHLFTKFFSIPMPKLRSLTWHYCDITLSHWNALTAMKPSFISLTSLLLKCIPMPGHRRFYRLLSQIPCLRTLELDHALPGLLKENQYMDLNPSWAGGYTEQQGLPEYLFPHLCWCTLSGPSLAIADFQSRISYPKDTITIRLISDAEAENTNTSMITTLLDSCGLLRDTSSPRSHPVLVVCNVDEKMTRSFDLRLGDDPESLPRAPRRLARLDYYQPFGSVYMSFNPGEAQNLFANRFIQYIHVIGLKMLHFSESSRSVITELDWHSFLLRHSEITDITLSYPGKEMLSALSSTINHNQSLCLPQLETLSVDLGGMYSYSPSERLRWSEMLTNCLSQRHDSRFPVKRLVFSIYSPNTVNDATMVRIKRVVDIVKFA